MEMDVLALCASNLTTAFMRFYGEKFEYPNYLVDTLKRLPCVAFGPALASELATLVSEEVSRRRNSYRNYEPFCDFTLPASVKQWSNSRGAAWNPKSFIGRELEVKVAAAFGITESQLKELEFDVLEAVEACTRRTTAEDSAQADEEGVEELCDMSPEGHCADSVSYSFGCAFGRWDIQYATGEKAVPELPDPFAPLPVCPPGQLQNTQGLPARPEDVHASYPIRITWDGILVDDPNHPLDIERRVREVTDIIWGAPEPERDVWNGKQATTTEQVEHEVCGALGVRSLRDYLHKPTGFFADHLKRYSKSRRKAPIYWPLSTESGGYVVWLYYHRLNDQTLYTIVNRYVEPKTEEVGRAIARLQDQLGTAPGREATHLRDQLDDGQSFLGELKDFREELLRVAALPYRPNLNDGVIINAAPLHKLFRHRQWARDCKQVWDKLERGEYDWAHLAYTIWPDRVREVCKRDRSIAIAHGLEDLCEVPAKAKAKPKRSKSRKKKSEAEEPSLFEGAENAVDEAEEE